MNINIQRVLAKSVKSALQKWVCCKWNGPRGPHPDSVDVIIGPSILRNFILMVSTFSPLDDLIPVLSIFSRHRFVPSDDADIPVVTYLRAMTGSTHAMT